MAREGKLPGLKICKHWRFRHSDLTALNEDDLSPTTIQNYKDNFHTYILPRWGHVLLENVKPSEVQAWLRSLKAVKETPVTPGSTKTVRKPLAPGTKAKIRNQMSARFSFAVLQDLWPHDRRNPIEAVKQSVKRQRKPDVLNIEETRAHLAELDRRSGANRDPHSSFYRTAQVRDPRIEVVQRGF